MSNTESTVAAKMYKMDCASCSPGHTLLNAQDARILEVTIIAVMRTGDSPASVSKGEVERIGLGGHARLVDETVRVEHHGVLVDLRVMHEVPTCSRE